MSNYYENRLQEINMLLGMGIEANSPNEAKQLRKERDQILKTIMGEEKI